MQAFAGETTHISAKAIDISQDEKNTLLTQYANNIENVSEIAKEGVGKNKLEQATAAFKAGVQATADIIAVEHSIGKTAKAQGFGVYPFCTDRLPRSNCKIFSGCAQ